MHLGITPQEIENERKRVLIYVFCAVGGILLPIFSMLSILQNRLALGAVLLLCCLLAVTMAYITRKIRIVQPICIVVAAILISLSSYLVLSGGVEGTGFFWSYPLCMVSVLIVGPNVGLVCMALYFTILGIGFFGSFTEVYPYTELEVTRLIATSVALYLLILASEKIRVQSYGAITLTSENHRQLANTDPLTKILNRHGIQSALSQKSIHQPAVVVLLDIDNFKSINDNYGHDAGDAVLIRLALMLKDNIKGHDLLARWGGEEFLLVLFDADINSAFNLMDKIRSNFSQALFSFGADAVTVKFSAGLAVLNSVEEFESIIKQADKRLYKAKVTGRNQIICHDTV
jgi:diguanylate cyclase (GGDEF)-like protein